MRDEKDIQSGAGILKLGETAAEAPRARLSIEHGEKGTFRSMWEVLMQLRVLLPYLTRLAPLLDRGLVKAAPDLTEFRKDLEPLHIGNRELGVQVRNQALQLDRIEEQLLRLREASERNWRETGELSRSLRSLTVWARAVTVLTALVFVALIVFGSLSIARIGH